MGRKDTLTKKYLEQPEIFADAFNYYIFNGRKVIKPKDLQEQDPNEKAVIEKRGRTFANQKMRDILRLCTIRHTKYATLVLLAIEAQADISYIMPVRDNLYDALNYADQVENIKRKHKAAGDLKGGTEYLSGFTKKDKIIPVITLCVCFDKAKWDGPRALSDMFVKVDPRIKPFINDYMLNLISPGEIKDFTKFSTGLGLAMEFIQVSDDKKKLRDIIEERDSYKNVDVATVDIINTYTAAKISKKEMKGGKVNMCTAIQGLIEDGRNEGLKEGRKEGIVEGADMLARLLKLLTPGSREFDKALNASEAERRRLYKKYKIID